MVCDFFYPQPGGVEFHIYHLAQQLIARGHSVIIITHSYRDRRGIRYLTNGLKVYYMPFFAFYRNASLPTIFSAFPLLRNVYIREGIQVVHGHASMSPLTHEGIMHAHTMGLKTVMTEHSLFGFADVGSIMGNKSLGYTSVFTNHLICVSHTCKENVVLRGKINPSKVSVIPNAVISEDFKPAGVCKQHEKVRFIIAGDGPKFVEIQQTIETYRLQDRVELIGGVKHEEVRNLMVKGDIYLHASLTEAFGTVLVEAASCGLLVVTTRVGGVPEVLPPQMTIYANPSVDSLVKSASKAIRLIEAGKVDTSKFHLQVKNMYSWEDVARRTEIVYDSIPDDHKQETIDEIKEFSFPKEQD
ncbi:K03857 phosphatidylinositol glycan, class A [Cyberlindnera jadinii]|uniref:Phosphatidylinositol N-acetylglucosaminyltransferase GPI3 subunit n=1 Tax=Cyberlindnera jadinii (strain ATCC 18201 / CBS 1600 / BCRC 20928 / JCM 3617 / NBRC 0987 / NRRL Y-1542) TaxID=983966 RepID=A0A0H5C040_CYBJN|nr:K03857 phosphatidylinositol glycan, class A [Cyberlindnera jadinii]